MRKGNNGFIIIIIVVVILLLRNHANAQAPTPYVCRDTTYEGGIRYQFRNLPTSWNVTVGIWYVAADGELSADGSTFTADAITDYPLDASGIKPGEAVVGASDYSLILRGTADTAPCDLPPESTPTAPQCPAWAISGETGELICLWSLPPASS